MTGIARLELCRAGEGVVRRLLILVAYVVGFGLVLPAALLGLGLLLDALLGLRQPAVPFPASVPPVLLGILLWVRGTWELLRVGRGPPISALPPASQVETGPFFYFRHPLYVGFQMLLVGVALVLQSAGCLLVAGPAFLLIWLAYARSCEEPALLRRFGAAYRRFRAETGVLLPSLPVAARLLVVPLLRVVFGLRVLGAEAIPRAGGLVLFGLHRSYLDPLIMSVGVRRKVHFLTTVSMFRRPLAALLFRRLGCVPLRRFAPDPAALRKGLAAVASGGVLGVFPEGGRSWAGEAVCDPAAFRLLERAGVPLVSAEIEGAYEYFPRFASLPRARRLTVRYRVWRPPPPPGRPTGDRVEAWARRLVGQERCRDQALAARRLSMPARGLETILYACPLCRELFSLRGSREGSVVCTSCGGRFMLLEGKMLLMPDGSTASLRELRGRNLGQARGAAVEGISFPGFLSRPGCAWAPAALVLSLRPPCLELRGLLRVPWDRVESVLIEGCRNLEILFRHESGARELVRFAADRRHSLFLQDALRLRAFGSPHSRSRGLLRRAIEP